MNKTTKIIAAITGLDFLGLNLYAAWAEGPARLLALGDGTPNTWLWVLVVDLLIALGVVCGSMYAHAKEAGRNPWPYIVLTMTTGSLGPLLYVVMAPVKAPAAQTLQARAA